MNQKKFEKENQKMKTLKVETILRLSMGTHKIHKILLEFVKLIYFEEKEPELKELVTNDMYMINFRKYSKKH